MKRTLITAISAAAVILTAISCSPVLAPSDTIPEGMARVTIQMRQPMRADPARPPTIGHATDVSGAKGILEPTRAIASSFSAIKVSVLDGTNVVASQTSADPGINMLVPPGTYTMTLDVYNYKVSQTDPMVSGSVTGITVTSGGSTSIGIMCFPNTATLLNEGAWTPKAAFDPYAEEESGNWTGTEAWYTCVPDDDAMTISTNGTGIVHYQVFDQWGYQVWEGTVGSGVKQKSMYVNPGDSYYIALTSYSPTKSATAIKYDSTAPVPVTGITISPSVVEAFLQTNICMFADVVPSNATDNLIGWSAVGVVSVSPPSLFISDPTLSIPDRNVYTTAIGTATVTATSDDGGFTAGCGVTVLATPATPWGSWTTTVMPGGPSAAAATPLPQDKWFADSADYKAVKWYSVPVIPGQDYWIYHDDGYSGSGTYSADCAVFAFHADGVTPYAWVDRGYATPLLVQPAEATVLVAVYANWEAGSFAVGVHKP